MSASAAHESRSHLLLDAALSYAAAPIPVFPLSGKKPVIPKSEGGNGFKDATTDVLVIQDWLNRYPQTTGLGTPTGNGIFVLDVDPAKGGEESLRALLNGHEALPATRETLTGGGGRQIFFSVPYGLTIPNSVSTLGAGLDIRGDGGYVVLPPIHPSRYEEALRVEGRRLLPDCTGSRLVAGSNSQRAVHRKQFRAGATRGPA
jgi:hypothetical protein